MAPKIEWFGEWFGSPYYHLLYKDRDSREARLFLDNLIEYLGIKKEDRILDLACGRGRHSIYLNQRGLNATGVDICSENIANAQKYHDQNLQFHVHDMRSVFKKNYFKYIFNFFTSFGYFDTKAENQHVVQAAYEGLVPGGKLLIDFLNPYIVIHNQESEEIKEVHGIRFHINKKLVNGMIRKNITFFDRGRNYHYHENVKAIGKVEFLEYFKNTGMEVLEIFGDYNLNPYVAKRSERMIFLAQK